MTSLSKEFACRVLELERKLSAYRRVHIEELDELERLISELRDQILSTEDASGGELRLESADAVSENVPS